jgi:hypothetical protein
LGLKNIISEGIVSGISEDQEEETKITHLLTNAAISAGSSGGPLLLTTGEVVGVTSFTYPAGQNLNGAVLWTHVENLIKNARAITALSTQPSEGPSKRLELSDVMSSLPKELQLTSGKWKDMKLQLACKWLDETYRYKQVRIPAIFTSSGVFENDLVYVNWLGRVKTASPISGIAAAEKNSYKIVGELKNRDSVIVEGTVLSIRPKDLEYLDEAPGVFISLGGCTIRKGESVKSLTSRPSTEASATQPSEDEKANSSLKLAETYLSAGIKDKATVIFGEIIKKYPKTRAAEIATKRLKEIQADTQPS